MRLTVGCNVCDGVVVDHQHICAVAFLEKTSVLELELMGRNAGTLGDGSLEVANADGGLRVTLSFKLA